MNSALLLLVIPFDSHFVCRGYTSLILFEFLVGGDVYFDAARFCPSPPFSRGPNHLIFLIQGLTLAITSQ